ncbi:hypothetical protein [Pseudomonas sp.]|uniref:hypothetical protein n=1 Tax=Pseudomonas sp. TaxID=306 RepID=UPI0028A902C4|nr:hypothetical protein [Pseudomonas sp.]
MKQVNCSLKYQRTGMSLQVLATVVLLTNGVMNILPWAGSAVVWVSCNSIMTRKLSPSFLEKLRVFRECHRLHLHEWMPLTLENR